MGNDCSFVVSYIVEEMTVAELFESKRVVPLSVIFLEVESDILLVKDIGFNTLFEHTEFREDISESIVLHECSNPFI